MIRIDRRMPCIVSLRVLALTALVGCDDEVEPLVRPAVAPELAVPEENELVLVAHAEGVQIYECVDTMGSLGWKLRAPRAELFDDDGHDVGDHFGGVDREGFAPGPYWESTDGSWVHADTTTVVSAANPGSIPLLRLGVKDEAGVDGTFAGLAYIHRLDTTGGVAPTTPCGLGQREEVDYTATYYFYATPHAP